MESLTAWVTSLPMLGLWIAIVAAIAVGNILNSLHKIPMHLNLISAELSVFRELVSSAESRLPSTIADGLDFDRDMQAAKIRRDIEEETGQLLP